MGVLTLDVVRKMDAGDIERELRRLQAELDVVDRQKADIEESRYRLLQRGERLGISYRSMSPWVGLTPARVHQLATGNSPGKRAAEARKALEASRKRQAEAAKNRRPPGRPRKVVDPETTD